MITEAKLRKLQTTWSQASCLLTEAAHGAKGGGGALQQRLSECAGWYFRVHVFVHLLRRDPSTRGWGVGLAHWVWGEG